ncbi:Fic family protein [Lactobacillus delbrueckii]|uniref:Fic family protein n=1 Tax=Lactobacillus delbrueckii TaxID=1584 RepID=UPI0022E96FDE|nr:Fic family protein [Lactobacillus delbrueckii]
MTELFPKELAELTALKDDMAKYRPLSKEQVDLLNQDIRLEHVWTSNALEGSTLTRYETDSIINAGITIHGKSLTETLEAVNLSQAYDYMIDLATQKEPLTQAVVRDLNRLATLEKEKAMADLIDWTRTAIKAEHPVQYAADLHRKFVSIHPFSDGNGRTARLLMNFALTESGYPVINIQPDAKSREQYMLALSDYQENGSEAPFTKLVIDYTRETLEKRIKILRANEVAIKEAENDTNLPRRN